MTSEIFSFDTLKYFAIFWFVWTSVGLGGGRAWVPVFFVGMFLFSTGVLKNLFSLDVHKHNLAINVSFIAIFIGVCAQIFLNLGGQKKVKKATSEDVNNPKNEIGETPTNEKNDTV